MQIRCLTTYLHGRERFERGDVRTVPDDDGAYFVRHGWAELADGATQPAAPAAGDVTLDIHNGQHGQEASHG